jgi:hypothetical protein
MRKHDDIPPIEALEAAARRDREETEELLAGFDRPGRGPKRARKRDFVAHYSGGSAGMGAGGRTAPPPDSSRRGPTFVVPRKPKIPDWLPWAGMTAGVVLFGGLVAFLATAGAPTRGGGATTPSATTTITSAQKLVPRARRDESIPPPGPPTTLETANVTVTTSATATATAPATTPRSSTSPRPRDLDTSSPSRREDFIRDL